ncbi:VOC family protein [Lutimonas halocynthiae]|uniref:VOC family protein n=1 Tax=Lutimonas halocynthiae TaxID=1446477 RepID=UPI0025B58E21|nr:VOC family protein [Lutimonas halocynthiae]MDN3643584.1 VOC family protein [Lutimonas halocynthiae]
MEANMVGWFEIPVSDMKRAQAFYEKVFGIRIMVEQFGDTLMGWFPFTQDLEAKGAGGSLVQNKKSYTPSADGTLVYFSSPEINEELKRVKEAGGNVLQEKTLIRDDIGYMALFLDTEGNRIALHSRA